MKLLFIIFLFFGFSGVKAKDDKVFPMCTLEEPDCRPTEDDINKICLKADDPRCEVHEVPEVPKAPDCSDEKNYKHPACVEICGFAFNYSLGACMAATNVDNKVEVTDDMIPGFRKQCLEYRKKQLEEGKIKDKALRDKNPVIEELEHTRNYSYNNCNELLKADRKEFNIPEPKARVAKKAKPIYRPDSCEWVDDLPRKIITTPKSKDCKDCVEICSGYISCESTTKGAPRFVRLATCGPENCTKEGAKACTKQDKYYSGRPKGVSKDEVSKGIQKVIGVRP